MRKLNVIATLWISLALNAAGPASAQQNETAEERIKTLSARIEKLEKQQEADPPFFGLADRIEISGLLEAEAAYSRFKPAEQGAGTEESSDIVFSTMELGVDIDMHDHVSGHLLFLWEEDATEPVDIDEGFITFSSGGARHFYLSAGKFYIPFGRYESFFISDPLTLELGETNESAVLLGYADDTFELSAGVFNGDVDEAGKDDHIGSWFAGASVVLAPDAIAGVTVSAGLSAISNIADSDLLGDETDLDGDGDPDGIRDAVPGVSGYLFIDFGERLFLSAEYTGAVSDFSEGEVAFDAGEVSPRAWSTELACAFAGGYGFGIKYEGTSDTGDLLPETRYGAIGFCQPFDGIYFGLEYLREEYENHDKGDSITAQLAYEF